MATSPAGRKPHGTAPPRNAHIAAQRIVFTRMAPLDAGNCPQWRPLRAKVARLPDVGEFLGNGRVNHVDTELRRVRVEFPHGQALLEYRHAAETE